MKYNYNVLLSDGYTRQTLPMVKALRELGCIVTVICYSKLDVAYSSKYPNNKIIVGFEKDDYNALLDKVIDVVKQNHIDLIIPLTDYSATLFAKNKKLLSSITCVAVNDLDIYEKAIDKLNTMGICMDNFIPCPKTLNGDISIECVRKNELKYPLVIKPRSACGSIGFRKVDSEVELKEIITNYDNSLGPLFIQEFIPQTNIQYNAHIFIDKHHEVKSAMVFIKGRWFPIDGGASTFSYTVENKIVTDICIKLLQSIRWNGYADLDLIVDPRDNTPKVIEINPRISANIKLCFLAGVNIAQLIIENELTDKVSVFNKYKLNMRMRCIHTDLLWLIKSPKRFKYKPSWFSVKNTKDQIFSISDPWPWFTFTIQSLFKFKKEMKKRERS